MTLDGMLKSHAAQSEQRPLICYPEKGVSDFKEYTAARIDGFVDSAVRFYVENGLEPAVRDNTILKTFKEETPNTRTESGVG